MPGSPAKSLTSTAASPPDTGLDPPRNAEELRSAGGARGDHRQSGSMEASALRADGAAGWVRAARDVGRCDQASQMSSSSTYFSPSASATSALSLSSTPSSLANTSYSS
jgi:hypothetical protein